MRYDGVAAGGLKWLKRQALRPMGVTPIHSIGIANVRRSRCQNR